MYLILLTIKVKGFDHYIQMGKLYKLKAHPNLTDEIHVDGYFCKIESIYYDIDEDQSIHLKLTADSDYVCKNKKEVVSRLIDELNELKEYGWYLNDYNLGAKYYESLLKSKII